MSTITLNDKQLEAVRYGDGPLLILAGAGSGKTRTLTARIAHLIQERGVAPNRILAITFTNKAATEMRHRVEELLGARAAGIWVATFHAACARVLRRDISALGYGTNFSIFAADEQERVVKDCLAELGWDPDRYPPRTVLGQIDAWKNALVPPDEAERQAGDYFRRRLAAVYRIYQEQLFRQNALDFGDLIMLAVRLLTECPDALAKYQGKFRQVLIDEYQDTNYAQYRLAALLAEAHGNLCVVGDDDQSIYGWRGADIRNILEFERDFPGARVVRLEQNYRSTEAILSAANHIVRNNTGRKGKTLWTARRGGEPVRRFEAMDEHDEAAFVARELGRLTDKGYRLSEVAVLYRINAQSRALEEEFLGRGVPHRVTGTRFYDRKEVRDILAYLRLIHNRKDEASLLRAINVPRRGVGGGTVARLKEVAAAQGVSLWDVLAGEAAGDVLKGHALREVRRFVALIEDLGGLQATAPAAELVMRLLDESGYLHQLEAEGTEESLARAENVRELAAVAADFEEHEEDPTLGAFLARVSLISDADTAGGNGDAVSLMTLHNAKGLEFAVVFMVGMEEGLFPHSRSYDSLAELEEERRLCYVGMTRAGERLYLTGARRRRLFGRASLQMPSRFLRELPPEVSALATAYAGAPAAVTAGLQPGPGLALDEGDKVRHPKWGVGKVAAVTGDGEEAIATLVFPELGVKRVAVKYAALEKVR
ncbi:MAG: UvrD-helicase domain-containing protein [Bacillota bacterium]